MSLSTNPRFAMPVLAAALLCCVGHGAAHAAGKPYSGPAPSDRTPPSLFKAYCANCHGEEMQGDGPLASRLAVKVPDLTRGMRLSSAPDGVTAIPQDVQSVLERGVPGSPMPSYAGLFSKPELAALSRHVAGLMKGDINAVSVDLGSPVDSTPDNVMDGAILYARAGCTQCHGFNGKGGTEAFVSRVNEDGSPARFPRMTHPVNWRGLMSARDIAMRIARGMPGTPMPAYRPALKDREIWQLAVYVETLAQVTSLDQLAREWVEHPPEEEPAARGAHMLSTMACVYCHRGQARDGKEPPMVFNVGPLGSYTAGPMLPATLGKDAVENARLLKAALVDGEGLDGRRLMPLAMPWIHFSGFGDTDITALTQALMAAPRAAEPGPSPHHAGWLDQVLGKLSAAGGVTALEMRMGGASDSDEGLHPRWVATGVFGASAVFAFFLLIIAMGGPKRSRRSRMAMAVTPLPVGAALAGLMLWPAYEMRLPSMLRTAMSAELPEPQGIGDEATRKVAMKGRELVGAAPCAACHTAQNPYSFGKPPASLAGGTRMRSAQFGMVYASNLTSDATGLGNHSREELRRALRAGVAKDGRVLHWEAMPYDLTGAYSDEELEAIITYLKAVPAVPRRMKDPAPADDFPGVAFSLEDFGE